MENLIQVFLYISLKKLGSKDLFNFFFRISSNLRNFQNTRICKHFLDYLSEPFLTSFFASFLADIVTLDLLNFFLIKQCYHDIYPPVHICLSTMS